MTRGFYSLQSHGEKEAFGLRWRKGIEIKMKEFLSIGERAIANIVKDTICGITVVVVNILSYIDRKLRGLINVFIMNSL